MSKYFVSGMHNEGLVIGGLDLLHLTNFFERNYSAIQSQQSSAYKDSTGYRLSNTHTSGSPKKSFMSVCSKRAFGNQLGPTRQKEMTRKHIHLVHWNQEKAIPTDPATHLEVLIVHK